METPIKRGRGRPAGVTYAKGITIRLSDPERRALEKLRAQWGYPTLALVVRRLIRENAPRESVE